MSTLKLKCLIVDDEEMARKLLEENCSHLPFLEVVGMAKNPFEAMQFLQEYPVDLMFLDIQMPGMLGTKFLHSLREKPMVIFVTAYDQYAVESYNLDVVDYLMKPVSMERFTLAAYKALEEQQKRLALAQLQEPKSPEESETVDYFFVNVAYALVKVRIPDILYVEGMKDYVKIYLSTADKPILTKSTLKAIEDKLPTQRFLRVHKSFIVNLDQIEVFRSQKIWIGQHAIPVSETYLEAVMQVLNP